MHRHAVAPPYVFTNNQAHIVTSGAVGRKVVDESTKLVVWLATSKAAQDLIAEIGPNAMLVPLGTNIGGNPATNGSTKERLIRSAEAG